MKRDVFAYELREVSADPVLEVAGYRIKPYRIAFPHPEARRAVEHFDMARLLPEGIAPATDELYHGLGFVVLHQARDGTYLLIGRWYDGNNLMSESFRVGGKPDAPELERLSLFACVWEMAVYQFERHAWVSTMMASGRAMRGAEQYLDCRFTGWV